MSLLALTIEIDAVAGSWLLAACVAVMTAWGLIVKLRTRSQSQGEILRTILDKLDGLTGLPGVVGQISIRLSELKTSTDGQHERTSERMAIVGSQVIELTRAVRAMWEHAMRGIEQHKGLETDEDLRAKLTGGGNGSP